MYCFIVCIALLLFDYNGQLLQSMPYALLSCSFVTLLYCYCFLNEINGDRDGDRDGDGVSSLIKFSRSDGQV